MDDLPYPHPTTPAASAVMRGNRRRDTKPEIAIRSLLHQRGYRFRKDYPIRVAGRLTRPDIVFTRQRVAVYVDGCFWHQCPQHGNVPTSNADYWRPKLQQNVNRDRETTAALEAEGWSVLRVWEHTATTAAVDAIERKLHTAE